MLSIGFCDEELKHSFPDSQATPVMESWVNGVPLSTSFREVAPGGARTSHPQHALDKPLASCLFANVGFCSQKSQNLLLFIVIYDKATHQTLPKNYPHLILGRVDLMLG